MVTKTTGAEWKAYHADPQTWPKGAWYEDCVIIVDGIEVEDLDDVQAVSQVIIDGGVYWPSEDMVEGVSLEAHFRRWRKAQTVERIVVEVPKEKAMLFREVMRRHGGKEIK